MINLRDKLNQAIGFEVSSLLTSLFFFPRVDIQDTLSVWLLLGEVLTVWALSIIGIIKFFYWLKEQKQKSKKK